MTNYKEIVEACPKCSKKEIHILHIDKEILFDMDLPKEFDKYASDYYILKCKNCGHYYHTKYVSNTSIIWT